MRVAVVGSNNLYVTIDRYIPMGTTEIVTGSSKGIDSLAEQWADRNYIPKLILHPDYRRYGRLAPLWHHKLIIKTADMVLVIWDGMSARIRYSIDYANRIGKPVRIILIHTTENHDA